MDEALTESSTQINEVAQQVGQAISDGADQVSQAFSEGASQAVDGAKEAISNNEVISYFSEFMKSFTPEKVIGLLAKIGVCAVIVIFGIICTKIIIKIVMKGMKKRGTDASVFSFIKTVIKFLVYTVTAISALSSLGMNISSLIAALASVGVAIGLGLQGSVSQLVSGILLIFNRPFKNGDYIIVNGIEGIVSEIRIMYTVLHTLDNKKIILPNSDITSNPITNCSAEENRRCDLQFGISYSDDIDKARRIILSVTENNQLVLSNPASAVLVSSHEASCVQLELRCWCKSSNYWDVYFSLQEEVKLSFDKEGISIPFNQMDIHIVK